MEKNYVCKKCGQAVSQDPEEVSEGYFGACLNCDEDFYQFELVEKVFNNDSDEFSQWTDKKLKEYAKSYYQSIYQLECYGSSDLQMYEGVCQELSTRGIDIHIEIYFKTNL